MCDGAQAKFNVVRIVYGTGDPSVQWWTLKGLVCSTGHQACTNILKKLIAKEFQNQHI